MICYCGHPEELHRHGAYQCGGEDCDCYQFELKTREDADEWLDRMKDERLEREMEKRRRNDVG